jgi:hypothetical protein
LYAEGIDQGGFCDVHYWQGRAHRAEAQPEQAPVAHMYADDYERMLNSETFCTVYSVAVGSPTRGETTIELFTTPSQRPWVGLTEKEIEAARIKVFIDCGADLIPKVAVYFACVIEAKLKELNT